MYNFGISMNINKTHVHDIYTQVYSLCHNYLSKFMVPYNKTVIDCYGGEYSILLYTHVTLQL